MLRERTPPAERSAGQDNRRPWLEAYSPIKNIVRRWTRLFAAIGPGRPLWEGLARFIADNYRVQQDLGFYGRNYGWALRFRKGGKALLCLYPGKEEFTVQIILGEAQVEEVLGLAPGRNVRKAIEDAQPYPEGRWLFIKVASERDLDQVKQLLTVKALLPKGR